MKETASQAEGIAREAFAEIATRFPHLEVIETFDDPVEISLRMPQQVGLKYPIWLGLQNEDELHFSVESFWLEWFPCTEPERVQRFVRAVCGFISGEYRVVEHSLNGTCYKAQLQKPTPEGWETIGTWSRLRWPSFRRPVVTVVLNA